MGEIEGKGAFAQVENAAAFDTKGGVGDYRAEAIAAEDVSRNRPANLSPSDFLCWPSITCRS